MMMVKREEAAVKVGSPLFGNFGSIDDACWNQRSFITSPISLPVASAGLFRSDSDCSDHCSGNVHNSALAYTNAKNLVIHLTHVEVMDRG